MTKKEYIEALDQYLVTMSASEKADILSDYEEHFRVGLENGKTESQIAASLGSPYDVANQFLDGEKPKVPTYPDHKSASPTIAAAAATAATASTTAAASSAPRPAATGTTQGYTTQPRPAATGTTQGYTTQPRPAATGTTQGYATQPRPAATGTTQGYTTQPRPAAAGTTQGYTTQPRPAAPAQGYASQQGYASPQGYAPQQGYANPQGYAPQQGYANPQGYASQQGYSNPQGYASQSAVQPAYPEQQNPYMQSAYQNNTYPNDSGYVDYDRQAEERRYQSAPKAESKYNSTGIIIVVVLCVVLIPTVGSTIVSLLIGLYGAIVAFAATGGSLIAVGTALSAGSIWVCVGLVFIGISFLALTGLLVMAAIEGTKLFVRLIKYCIKECKKMITEGSF
ncbi:MAG: DUF1700 domain-containing protein [Clostridia bacterium]|nr:DUF1700 domain-containing protein [Clostridia bacterium]